MEVAALQQPTTMEPVTDTMENSMDVDMDMDIDLGPLPEADAIETVSSLTCLRSYLFTD